jgi:hypothetical protein
MCGGGRSTGRTNSIGLRGLRRAKKDGKKERIFFLCFVALRKRAEEQEGEMQGDVLELVCQRLFDGSMSPVFLRSDERPEDEPSGELMYVLTQPKWLGRTAAACKQMRKELKAFRETHVAAVIEHLMLTAPTQALELCNIDQYADAQAIPTMSHMLFTVYLGKRVQFATAFYRQTVSQSLLDGEVARTEHSLSVQCGVPDGTGKSRLSEETSVPVHRLCFVSGYGDNFTEADMEEYDVWHQATNAALQACMRQQHAAVTALD